MKCFLLSKDLMFSSQVMASSKTIGCEVRTVSDPSVVDDGAIAILDLTTPSLAIAETIEGLASRDIRVIAVGPHVQIERLQAAKAAGAWQVISKGQAHRELALVLQSAAGDASSANPGV